MKFEMETIRKIWADDYKDHYEICPDADGLGCVEIRYRNDKNEIVSRMTFDPVQAKLISQALTLCAFEVTKT